MHFHFQGLLNWRNIRTSAIIIVLLLFIVFIFDMILGFSSIQRMYTYIVPFFLHVCISLFIKGKESWILGGMLGTMVTMVIIIVFLLIS